MQNTSETLRLIISDAFKNDPVALFGLLDYLIVDKGHDPRRLAKFASRKLGIHELLITNFFQQIYGVEHLNFIN